MKVLSCGPNVHTIYHYMKCKGYTANFDCNSGKREIIFTKTLHNPEFPTNPVLKGLVVVHKIQIDMHMGCIKKHWIENRGLPITCWDYLHLLEELQEQSVKFYKAAKDWMKGGWFKDWEKQNEKSHR